MRKRGDHYVWHRDTLAGKKPAITTEPQCGWFLRRTSRGSALVTGSIYMDQPFDPETGELIGDEVMRCEVAGQERDPAEEWLWLASRPVSQAEYLRLLAQTFADDGAKAVLADGTKLDF